MTTAIVEIHSIDGLYYSFYIGSDADPDTMMDLWLKYCKLVDEDTEKHQGRLNWIYVATNFMRYVQSTLYSHKTLEECNRVLVCPPNHQWESIYKYIIKPKSEDLYSKAEIWLEDATTFELDNTYTHKVEENKNVSVQS